MIITTNFDRLLEAALDDVGIQPLVIATTDAIKGAPPLQHSPCTVIKVHGDYRDTRIRNTDEELAAYPSEMSDLLDRVFDEHSLVFCGWSSEWDTALRDALSRRQSRRYPCYWCVKDPLSVQGKDLAGLLSAVSVPIRDANSFFESLGEKVSALDRISGPHPLSTPLAVESLKEYIADDRHRIRLRDLVRDAAVAVRDALLSSGPPARPSDSEELEQRLSQYEAMSEMIVALMANGIFWDRKEGPYNDLWPEVLEILAKPALEAGGARGAYLLRHPVRLGLCAAGAAACACGRLEVLAGLLNVEVRTDDKTTKPLYQWVWEDPPRGLPADTRFPLRQRVFDHLRPLLQRLVPDQDRLRFAYYEFEYLLALRAAVNNDPQVGGIFMTERAGDPRDILPRMEEELQRERTGWAPIAFGVLPGPDADTVFPSMKRLHERIRDSRRTCR